jgi:uncharacterized Zn-finger protein
MLVCISFHFTQGNIFQITMIPQQVLNGLINDKTCPLCKKVFHSITDLQRHKDRKKPCVINEIPENQKNNSYICTYCNNTYTTNGNLVKHQKSCKDKNKKVENPIDNIEIDQEIYENDEDNHSRENKTLRHRVALLERKVENMQETIDKLQEMIEKIMISNAHTINNDNSITNNITNHIHINNYLEPSYKHLLGEDGFANERFIKLFNQKLTQTPNCILNDIWFNADVPENLSVYLKDKSNGDVMVMHNNRWISTTFDEIALQLREQAYVITETLAESPKLTSSTHKNAKWRFQANRADEDQIKYDRAQILKAMKEGRDLVEPFIPDSGKTLQHTS